MKEVAKIRGMRISIVLSAFHKLNIGYKQTHIVGGVRERRDIHERCLSITTGGAL